MNKYFLPELFLAGMAITACSEKKKIQDSSRQAETYRYSVSQYKNNVSWSADNSVWKPVNQGLELIQGTWVETGLGSYTCLEGTLGDVVILGERAKVRLLIESLKEYASPGNHLLRGLKLFRGIAQFNVRNAAGTFIVETPSAKINVQGTRFIVAHNDTNRETKIWVSEGLVEVADTGVNDQKILLQKNETMENIGIGKKIKRKFTTADSSMIHHFERLGFETRGDLSIIPARTRDIKQIRKNIREQFTQDRQAPNHQQKISGQGELSKERTNSTRAMDKIRKEFGEDKRQIHSDFSSYKEKQTSALAEERMRLRGDLQQENILSGSDSDSAEKPSFEDAFEELKRRRAEEK